MDIVMAMGHFTMLMVIMCMMGNGTEGLKKGRYSCTAIDN